jgi:hypothetical protein
VRALALLLVLVAAPASAQQIPPAYEAASDVRAHFEAEASEDGSMPALVLSRSDGHDGWRQVGIAPSDVVLPPGPVALALATHGHTPVRIALDIAPTDGARLVGHYESRQWLRELGVGILLGAAALTLVGIAIGASGFLANDPAVGAGGLVAGACVAIVGGATGIALATLDDLATLDVL